MNITDEEWEELVNIPDLTKKDANCRCIKGQFGSYNSCPVHNLNKKMGEVLNPDDFIHIDTLTLKSDLPDGKLNILRQKHFSDLEKELLDLKFKIKTWAIPMEPEARESFLKYFGL